MLNMHQQKVISVKNRESYINTHCDKLIATRVVLMWEIRIAVLSVVTHVSGQRNCSAVCFMCCSGQIPRLLASRPNTVTED